MSRFLEDTPIQNSQGQPIDCLLVFFMVAANPQGPTDVAPCRTARYLRCHWAGDAVIVDLQRSSNSFDINNKRRFAHGNGMNGGY